MRWMMGIVGASFVGLVSVGCGDDGGVHPPPKGCTVKDQIGCPSGQVCEEVESASPACFEPVMVAGSVTDISTQAPLHDVRIVARDEGGIAISRFALSNPDGSYHLQVPAPRDAAGVPLPRTFTLRVDASGYEAFPEPPRVAAVLDVAKAKGPPYVIQNADTDVSLLHLANTMSLGSISGQVVADEPGGTLVLASGQVGVTDLAGSYVVFNVPPGDMKVNAFKQGLNFDVTTTRVDPSAETKNVDLNANTQPTAKVTGDVQLVNVSGKTTTVLLALEDTFDAALVRGESPPGLRASNITSAFAIAGVPDGKYVVLTGFENDGLVRDPDTSVAGTQIAHVTVTSGGDQSVMEPLAVLPALAVVSPGATTVDTVAGTPKLVWDHATGNDAYHVEVFDGFGAKVWEISGMFDQGGGMPATVDYGGPPLQSGMLYQFRATALLAGKPLTSTEDLRGAFVFQ